MLVKLLPEQAAKYWDDIKVAVEESLPPVVGMQPDRLSNILRSILIGELTVWISVEKRSSGNVITGIILTSFTFDKNSGTKALLVYSVYGYSEATKESWESGFETLVKFGKSKGCHRMLGYTDVPSLIALSKRYGAETRYTLVSLPL